MDGFTPFWEPLFAYATDRSPENEAKVRPLLTPEANVWQWTHGTRDPITWGKNDEIFGPDGAYLTDLPDAELHLLDTGHFALEEELDFIAERIRDFLTRHTS